MTLNLYANIDSYRIYPSCSSVTLAPFAPPLPHHNCCFLLVRAASSLLPPSPVFLQHCTLAAPCL